MQFHHTAECHQPHLRVMTLHDAMKQRRGSYTCLLLPECSALTGKQKQGSALSRTLSS